ncbi:hypothetical protein GCM10007874_58570 [Labrys miyagiensis]|uniref:Uncharacterized protein n=1 Tax=Labrys miyagiensis TaxID=346912 RepID=A0ABQ6CTE5_9HYPH|nr:hypothetical protein [Labrys miyagiensis]GLS22837.1 hypothetical protein GCM10007874_58570 [Labrys miyagiensis]
MNTPLIPDGIDISKLVVPGKVPEDPMEIPSYVQQPREPARETPRLWLTMPFGFFCLFGLPLIAVFYILPFALSIGIPPITAIFVLTALWANCLKWMNQGKSASREASATC